MKRKNELPSYAHLDEAVEIMSKKDKKNELQENETEFCEEGYVERKFWCCDCQAFGRCNFKL